MCSSPWRDGEIPSKLKDHLAHQNKFEFQDCPSLSKNVPRSLVSFYTYTYFASTPREPFPLVPMSSASPKGMPGSGPVKNSHLQSVQPWTQSWNKLLKVQDHEHHWGHSQQTSRLKTGGRHSERVCKGDNYCPNKTFIYPPFLGAKPRVILNSFHS